MYHTPYKFKLDQIFDLKENWFFFWVANQGALKMLSLQNRLQCLREMLFWESAVFVWISRGFQKIWEPSGTLLMRVLCCGVLQCVAVCCSVLHVCRELQTSLEPSWYPNKLRTVNFYLNLYCEISENLIFLGAGYPGGNCPWKPAPKKSISVQIVIW